MPPLLGSHELARPKAATQFTRLSLRGNVGSRIAREGDRPALGAELRSRASLPLSPASQWWGTISHRREARTHWDSSNVPSGLFLP